MAYTCPSISGYYCRYYVGETERIYNQGATLPTVRNGDEFLIFESSSAGNIVARTTYDSYFGVWESVTYYGTTDNAKYPGIGGDTQERSEVDFSKFNIQKINGKNVVNSLTVIGGEPYAGEGETRKYYYLSIIDHGYAPDTYLETLASFDGFGQIDISNDGGYSNITSIKSIPSTCIYLYINNLYNVKQVPLIPSSVERLDLLNMTNLEGIIEFQGTNTSPTDREYGDDVGLYGSTKPIKLKFPQGTSSSVINSWLNSANNNNVSLFRETTCSLLTQRYRKDGQSYYEDGEGTSVKCTLTITGDNVDTDYIIKTKINDTVIDTRTDILQSTSQSIITWYLDENDEGQPFSTSNSYNIQVEVTPVSHTLVDGNHIQWDNAKVVSDTLTTAFFTIHVKDGGKEIAFGTSANDNDIPSNGLFKCGMDANFLSKLSYNGYPIVDFVTEQGERNGWTYRVWYSGKRECWTKLSVSATLSTSNGGWYSNGTSGAATPDFPTLDNGTNLFTEEPMKFISAENISSTARNVLAGIYYGNVDHVTNFGNYVLFRGNSLSGSNKYNVYMRAIQFDDNIISTYDHPNGYSI